MKPTRTYRIVLEHVLDELETWILVEELGAGTTKISRQYRMLHKEICADLKKVNRPYE